MCMSYSLSEQKVLDKLGISSFRELSKDNVVQCISMLPKMSPDVAKAAIAQFPAFAEAINSTIKNYKDIANDMLLKNEKCSDTVMNGYIARLNIIQNELNNESLSFEEKKYLYCELANITSDMDKLDSKNKAFMLKLVGSIAASVAVTSFAIASALGVSVNLPTKTD